MCLGKLDVFGRRKCGKLIFVDLESGVTLPLVGHPLQWDVWLSCVLNGGNTGPYLRQFFFFARKENEEYI